MYRTSAAFMIVLLCITASAGAQAKPTQPTPAKPAQPTPVKPTQPTPAKPTQPTSARPGQAKPTPRQPIDRIYVSVNGAFQTGGENFGETVTFRENAEDGRFTTDYEVKSGPALNISVGYRASAIVAGLLFMFAIAVGHAIRESTPAQLMGGVARQFQGGQAARALAG